MINVPVTEDGRQRFAQSERIRGAVQSTEVALQGRGRVILRPSGTEPLIRVTLEGEDPERVAQLARELADTVAAELGAAPAA
jgi:phosphoglucosamine mutase